MVDGGQNAIWLPLYFARNSLPPTGNQKTSFVLFRRSKTTRLLTLELNNRARCAADVRSFCWRERILASERGSHTRGLSCVDKKQDLLEYHVGTRRNCTEGEAKGETKWLPLCFPWSHQKCAKNSETQCQHQHESPLAPSAALETKVIEDSAARTSSEGALVLTRSQRRAHAREKPKARSSSQEAEGACQR